MFDIRVKEILDNEIIVAIHCATHCTETNKHRRIEPSDIVRANTKYASTKLINNQAYFADYLEFLSYYVLCLYANKQ